MCRRWSGEAPTNWFDLQIAAGLVGLTYPLGHGPLVYQLLGHHLTKAETLTEWRHRPLSSAQIGYAYDDVRYLILLWQQLDARLETLGRRDWARQEFARFTAAALPDTPHQSTAIDKWRKLRGVGSMDRRRLAMVREMFFARESIAAEMNRPPRVLIRDDLLIEIARRNPKSPGDVQVVRGMAKRFVTLIWEAIERARALPADQLPIAMERDQDPPQVALIVSLLGAILNDFCARNQLATSLTATMSDVKELVRSRMQNDQPPASNLLMTGWRRDFVLPILQEVLEGKRSVRITNLQSESPFALES